MSYNITTLKVRSIDLKLPLNFSFQAWLQTQPDRTARGYENVGKRWCLESVNRVQIDLSLQTWEIDLGNQSLSGTIADNQLVTTTWDCTDEGSGHLYEDIFIPLFRDFKAHLSALVVWEGGDTVSNLKIQDGIVEENEIE